MCVLLLKKKERESERNRELSNGLCCWKKNTEVTFLGLVARDRRRRGKDVGDKVQKNFDDSFYESRGGEKRITDDVRNASIWEARLQLAWSKGPCEVILCKK